MCKMQLSENVFPIWKIERDCLLSKQGGITIGFLVSLPEIYSLDTPDYQQLHAAWLRLIKSLPAGTILHKQDWFLQSTYNGLDDDSFLTIRSNQHFHEYPFFEHESFLYLTKLPGQKATGNALSSALFGKSILPSSLHDEQQVAAWLETAAESIVLLEDTGLIHCKRLTAADYGSTAAHMGLLERYYTLSSKEEPRMLGDLHLGDEFRVGEKSCQVFTLSDADQFPSICGPRITDEKYATDQSPLSIGFVSPIGVMLQVDHILNHYIIIEDAADMLSDLEKKRKRFESLSLSVRENAINQQAINEYLNEAKGGGKRPVKMHLNLIAINKDDQDPGQVRSKVIAAFAKLDATPKLETLIAPQLFWASIPGNADSVPVHDTMLSFAEQAICFICQETTGKSSISPVGLRLSERTMGIPLQVDLSDEPMQKGIISNRNKFVLGPSGSGKSFFCNHMLRSYLEQGSHALIIDVGHSYKGLCNLLGGYYFTYAESSPIAFNPFYVTGPPDTEKKESLKTLLLALWKKDNEPFSRAEYVALSNAVDGYYHLVNKEYDFNSFYEFLRDQYKEQLLNEGVQKEQVDIDNLLYVLRPYYKGGFYDFLLNSQSQLDTLNQPLIIFELDSIKDHPILFPVVTLIIMDVFITKMRKLKGIRKMILIEEAWKAIAKAGMAEYIKYLFKTVRKFFGEAIVVTQDIDDILSSSIIKDTIINNSDCKILLDQSKYLQRFETIQELLGLSDKEAKLILSLNKAIDPALRYKEVFIGLGSSVSKIYRVQLSPHEYYAYTTEEKEKKLVESFAVKYGSLKMGIDQLVKQNLES